MPVWFCVLLLASGAMFSEYVDLAVDSYDALMEGQCMEYCDYEP